MTLFVRNNNQRLMRHHCRFSHRYE